MTRVLVVYQALVQDKEHPKTGRGTSCVAARVRTDSLFFLPQFL